jgi:hypothetical protein
VFDTGQSQIEQIKHPDVESALDVVVYLSLRRESRR